MISPRVFPTRMQGATAGLVAALILSAFAGVSRSSAAQPWWHMTVSSRPSSLKAGVSRSEVQEITTVIGSPNPEAEDNKAFQLMVNGHPIETNGPVPGVFESAPYSPGNFPHATAANVQAALESVAAYGPGNVIVTGQGPEGVPPLTVRTVNGQADRLVEPVKVSFALPGGTAKATVVTLGRPDGEIVLVASNLGDSQVEGEAQSVTIAGGVPSGLEVVGMTGVAGGNFGAKSGPVNCSMSSVSCTFEGALFPYGPIEVSVPVDVKPGAASGETVTAAVSGGRAGTASGSRQLVFGGEPAFGVESFEMEAEEEGGTLDTQAGSHPFQFTTTLDFNQTGEAEPATATKDLNVKLPPGLIGNPTPFPRCTIAEFVTLVPGKSENECRPETAVGMSTVSYMLNREDLEIVPAPLFNLEPENGEPARFGFYAGIVPIVLDTAVRTGGDYGVTVSAHNASQLAGYLSSQVTFWGVPGDPRHDNVRGWECLHATEGEGATCQRLGQRNPLPLLTLPTSCNGPLQSTVEADSWDRPGDFLSFALVSPMPALSGCNRLPFGPEVVASPDGQKASTPTGLTVDVHVPQEGQLNPTGDAESNIRKIRIAFPEGFVVNPSSGDGLQACSEAQIGYLPGESAPPEELRFTATLPEPLEQGLNFCPDAAKIGTVRIKTPLLPNPLEGALYLATPAPNGEDGKNPFKTLLALYIVAKDPVSGSLVKLPGTGSLDPSTGQLVSTFENTPQLAFEDAEIHLFGGERAPLATPARCGTYTTEAEYTPWSGTPPVKSTSSFEITSGPGQTACPGQNLPFSPSLTAGTTSIQAGGFSPFTMTMSRTDGNQDLQAINLRMPPGLSGLLTGVKLCGESEANNGTCGPESMIGETTVSVGVGSSPFSVKGGKVYITGPYEGAPFGLSIVNPAKAGPFDLEAGTPCDCVVVRAKIEVDPITAALTITSDNTGPYKIPTIIDGIPLQIQHVNVTINRPGFTFNPTDCNPLQITGALDSAEGAQSSVDVPLQVTNCATLGFKPSFKVSTSGKTSRASGASLHVKLAYPKAPFGSQANIRSVKVSLPKQLPSQLKTLQQACPDSTFNANPAMCGARSRIGTATATTPLLPVSLTGPVYFVSHGGAKFPELVIVLSGYGVTVQLHAETFISKAGITSSTFRTIPDVPVNTFELTLPQGKYPALAAPGGDLCKDTLKMPTAFTAQNGLIIHQSTPISVTDCPKHKHAKKAHKHNKK